MQAENKTDSKKQEQLSQRVALLLDYLGTNYHGSQHQPGLDTIQSEIVKALKALNIEPQSFAMAGRTDAGVHSRGQVAHFEMPEDQFLSFKNFIRSVNTKLPPDIQLKDIQPVPESFHSRRNSEYKWYRYKIYNAPRPSLWIPPDVTWHRYPLDVDKMNAALQLITGEYNFKSYKSVNTPVTDDVCHVIYADIYRTNSITAVSSSLNPVNSGENKFQLNQPNPLYSGLDLITLDIVSNRFLYKMIRNIMGQLITIGTDPDLSPEVIVQILQEEDRTKASATAPAQGLCKMAAYYPPPYNIFSNDPYVRLLTQLVEEKLPSQYNDLNPSTTE